MAANTNPIFVSTRKVWNAQIDPGDGTTPKTIVTSGSYGSIIEALAITSKDTADATILLAIGDGSIVANVGHVLVPAGSGTNGTASAVDALDPVYLPWLPDDQVITIAAGGLLQVNALAAVTAAVQIVAIGGDY